MAPRPTVIGTQGYRRGLASLSVVKERLFRVHRNVPRGHMLAAANNCIGTLSGGTYRTTYTCSGFVLTNPETRRGLAFQLCLPQLPLSFCFVFKSFATCFGNPSRNFLPLVTRY